LSSKEEERIVPQMSKVKGACTGKRKKKRSAKKVSIKKREIQAAPNK